MSTSDSYSGRGSSNQDSSSQDFDYDITVIGSGPAGQKAAVQAAKAGQRVALIERDRVLGGACVHRGTIPSKTLRENALRVNHMRSNAELANYSLPETVEMNMLITRLDRVLKAHDHYMGQQIGRNNIEVITGRASFQSIHSLEVSKPRGQNQQLRSRHFVIATGSFPRNP